MPTEGFENCGNATLVAARSVPNLVPAGAVSASVLTLNLTTATLLELQFNEFGKCAPPTPPPRGLHLPGAALQRLWQVRGAPTLPYFFCGER